MSSAHHHCILVKARASCPDKIQINAFTRADFGLRRNSSYGQGMALGEPTAYLRDVISTWNRGPYVSENNACCDMILYHKSFLSEGRPSAESGSVSHISRATRPNTLMTRLQAICHTPTLTEPFGANGSAIHHSSGPSQPGGR